MIACQYCFYADLNLLTNITILTLSELYIISLILSLSNLNCHGYNNAIQYIEQLSQHVTLCFIIRLTSIMSGVEKQHVYSREYIVNDIQLKKCDKHGKE